jgi:hypothetical protein
MKILQLVTTVMCIFQLIGEARPATFNAREKTDCNTIIISKMIGKVQPEIKLANRIRIASSIGKIAQKYQIDPKLMIAIIGTESDFSNTKISSTGDLSMAQINTEIWNKEFTRLGLEKLNKTRLKKDEVYALNKMAEILNILKNRHAKKDKYWFARYHSHTKKFKNVYQSKVQSRINMIASLNILR